MAVRFSELLLREGRITPAQLEVALNHQRTSGGRLGATLVRLRHIGVTVGRRTPVGRAPAAVFPDGDAHALLPGEELDQVSGVAGNEERSDGEDDRRLRGARAEVAAARDRIAEHRVQDRERQAQPAGEPSRE